MDPAATLAVIILLGIASSSLVTILGIVLGSRKTYFPNGGYALRHPLRWYRQRNAAKQERLEKARKDAEQAAIKRYYSERTNQRIEAAEEWQQQFNDADPSLLKAYSAPIVSINEIREMELQLKAFTGEKSYYEKLYAAYNGLGKKGA